MTDSVFIGGFGEGGLRKMCCSVGFQSLPLVRCHGVQLCVIVPILNGLLRWFTYALYSPSSVAERENWNLSKLHLELKSVPYTDHIVSHQTDQSVNAL
jgi:hypothetical protein